MNERDEETPFPREPWQRLLEDSSGSPPETTDARIRAAARRDLAPRGQRWWLPASLAASLVLAIVIVRSELGSGGRVRIDESARGGDAAMDARIIDRNEGEQAREPGRAPAAASQRQEKQREESEPDVYGYADSEQGQESAGTAPRVSGPELELKAASELPGEAPAPHPNLDVRTVSAERLPRDEPAPPPVTNAVASEPPDAPTAPSTEPAPAQDEAERRKESQSVMTDSRSGAGLVAPPTPEAWYAAIEKLRAEGRIKDADRELERLKKAYPGWLEQHLTKQAKP